MDGTPNWKRFWKTLRRLGAGALSGVPRKHTGLVDATAGDTDDFWSAALVDRFGFEWSVARTPEDAVRAVLMEYAENVRTELLAVDEDAKVDRLGPTKKAALIRYLAAAMTPRPTYDSVADLERFTRYQDALRAGGPAARLMAALYTHCHRRHTTGGVPTRLRWPEPAATPPGLILFAEPAYFGFGTVDLAAGSVSVLLSTTDYADFVPHTLSRTTAADLRFSLVAPATGPRAGVARRIRFVVTREDQIPPACRVLDRAHALYC
jgi:hypothetical protein